MRHHPDDPFGDWLHAECVAQWGEEREAWALERVERVMARLNAARPDGRALRAEILAMPEPNAFTAPGRWVYLGRVLLERCLTDDMAAFILAHEIAHHDCGHVASLQRGWAAYLPSSVAGTVTASIFRAASHALHGPEREAEADRYAIALCLDAGYDAQRCLQAFDLLEMVHLDRGDIDGVFGPEALLDPSDPLQASWKGELGKWLWTRSRRYLPLRERRALVEQVIRRRARRAQRGG